MSSDFNLNCPVPLSDHATVQMAHGGGGRVMRNLIESLFLPAWVCLLAGGVPMIILVGIVPAAYSYFIFRAEKENSETAH